MPRSLTLHRTVVTPSDRAKFFERLRTKEAHYQAAGCRFWAFEEASVPGAFIEFVEANDAATLTAAHAAAPERLLDPARIYTSVELT